MKAIQSIKAIQYRAYGAYAENRFVDLPAPAAAQKTLIGYLSEGAIQPTIAKVFPLSAAAEAVRHLIEDRPYGRVLMRVED